MALPKSEFIWFNGELVPWDEARIHVLAHVLHYGSSVFEGIRAYETRKGPAVLGLDAHVKRLFFSSRVLRMEIPFSPEQIAAAICDLVRRNGHRSCYIRPLVFRGYETLGVYPRNCPVETVLATWEWGAYLGENAQSVGVDVGVSSWRRMAPDTLMAMAKIGGQYVNSQLTVMEARDHGYTEGILLDVQGFVAEGSGENIFIVRDGVLHTPPQSASILAGITRSYVITLAREAGLEVREENIPREMLFSADELFFTGSAVEITPIKSVDGIPIGEGCRGPLTERLQTEFFGIVHGEVEDRHGWLTPIDH